MGEIFSFAGLFTLESLFTLLMLILLQAVLGFDNLLYISIESKRVEAGEQARVRRIGIIGAIGLRIVLLVAIMLAVQSLQTPFLSFGKAASDGSGGGWIAAEFNVHSVIVLLGGVFIIYTALKEIYHMLSVQDVEGAHMAGKARRTPGAAIFWIMLMNLIFSFDSILSAIALTSQFWVMTIAIVISGVMMVWLADTVSEFLKKNRMYEVLGLFILLIVGIMLLSEGGHLAHLKLFGYAVEPLSKTTFYFSIFVLVAVDIVQSSFQKKLMRQKEAEIATGAPGDGAH